MHDLTAILNHLLAWLTHFRIALLLGGCAALGAAGAWLIAGIPFREHLLDAPNERSSHTEPTPRGGGVGILAAFTVAGMALNVPTTFLSAAILVSAVSFYGDYFRISVKFRLIVQLIAASVLLLPMLPRLAAHYDLSTFGFSPFIFFLILPMIFLFLIGSANFYNFMDGINGIAGLSGAIAFGLMGVYALNRPAMDPFQTSLSWLSIGIALACLGYLPFNMPRARVFMGDVGSILLGFVFAALVVTLARNYQEMACLAALLFPFYADELTTMAVRIRDHEHLSRPHRRHLYQLLANEAGIPHWIVSLIYAAGQLLIGAVVLIAYPFGAWRLLLFLSLCFIGFTLLSLYIRHRYRTL